MFGSTGYIHKEPKRTKAELASMMRLEARSHAETCEALALALRGVGVSPKTAEALEKAAKFIRHFAEGDK